MNKSNDLAAITGFAANVYIIIAFLPMTASACTVSHIECTYPCIGYYPNGVDCKKMSTSSELYVFNGNPFIGNTDSPPLGKDPRFIPVDPPTLDPGPLPVIDPVTLPPDPKSATRLKNESIAVQTVKGLLHRVGAIGGETTGWAIRLDSPLRASATMQVNKIEVAADCVLLEPLLGRQVQARGRITWRQGIERGRYPVMMLESIRRQ